MTSKLQERLYEAELKQIELEGTIFRQSVDAKKKEQQYRKKMDGYEFEKLRQQEELEMMSQELKTLRYQHQNSQDQFNHLNKELQSTVMVKDEYQRKLQQQEHMITQLKREVKDHQFPILATQESNFPQSTAATSGLLAHSDQETKVHLLEKQTCKLYQELKDLRQDKAQLRHKNDQLRLLYIQIQEQLNHTQAQLDSLDPKEMVNDMQMKYQNECDRTSKLLNQLNETQQQNTLLSTAKRELVKENDNLRSHIQRAQEQLQQKEIAIAEMSMRMGEQERYIENLERDFKMVGIDISPEGIASKSDDVANEAIYRDLLRKKAQLEDLEKQNRNLHQENSDMRQHLESRMPPADTPKDTDSAIEIEEILQQALRNLQVSQAIKNTIQALKKPNEPDVLQLLESLDIGNIDPSNQGSQKTKSEQVWDTLVDSNQQLQVTQRDLADLVATSAGNNCTMQ